MSDFDKIVLGAVAGFALGLLAEPIKRTIGERHSIKQLTDAVITEICRNFQTLMWCRYHGGPKSPNYFKSFQDKMEDACYNHARQQVTLYHRLPLHQAFDTTYLSFDSFKTCDYQSLIKGRGMPQEKNPDLPYDDCCVEVLNRGIDHVLATVREELTFPEVKLMKLIERHNSEINHKENGCAGSTTSDAIKEAASELQRPDVHLAGCGKTAARLTLQSKVSRFS
jgi:hypothetical protein